MVITCWSVKGGSGTTVVASCLAMTAARHQRRSTLLVDPVGDVPAVLGIDEPTGAGLTDWPLHAEVTTPRTPELRVDHDLSVLPRGPRRLEGIGGALADRLFACWAADGRLVVADAGTIDPEGTAGGFPELVDRADRSILVIRPCYLALRRAARSELRVDGVVLVKEPGRALGPRDAAAVIGAPVIAEIDVEPQIARLVDAGLLCARLPRSVDRALGDVVDDAA